MPKGETLKKAIEKSFKKTAGLPDTESNKNIETLSEDLTQAFTDF